MNKMSKKKIVVDVDMALDHIKKETGVRPSVYSVAKDCGINRNVLSDKGWKAGNHLKTIETLKKFSDFVGLPIDELIKEVDDV